MGSTPVYGHDVDDSQYAIITLNVQETSGKQARTDSRECTEEEFDEQRASDQ
jgi:hypothetical protein